MGRVASGTRRGMGMLTRWENTLEHWESALVDKVMGNDPVELLDDLRTECDDHAVVCAAGRVLVPNAYTVELAPDVHEELTERGGHVGQALTDVLARHAAKHEYEWAGPLTVHVAESEDLSGERYRITSRATPNILAEAFPDTAPEKTEASPRRCEGADGSREPLGRPAARPP